MDKLFSVLTAAQVGSSVRWIFTILASNAAVVAYTQGLDLVAIGAAVATVAQLLWSWKSNTVKVSA